LKYPCRPPLQSGWQPGVREVFALMMAAILLSIAGRLASGADEQRAADAEGPAGTRAALRLALSERQAAEQRSLRLEGEAEAARTAAERTARQAAAIAARIQQAEA